MRPRLVSVTACPWRGYFSPCALWILRPLHPCGFVRSWHSRRRRDSCVMESEARPSLLRRPSPPEDVSGSGLADGT